MRRYAVAVLIALLALHAGALAQAADRRVVVDPNAAPWNAVVRVQTNIGERCSGVVIAPTTVLTAAHCLYNPRTRSLLQPGSVHVLLGYQRGAYRWHGIAERIAVGTGYDGRIAQPQTGDWARIDLAESVPAAPLPVVGGWLAPGLRVALAGYYQDRAQLLMADMACHVLHPTTLSNGAVFLAHDCAGALGTSGGPLLVRQGDGWAVVAINIAIGRRDSLALPIPPAVLALAR